MRCYPPTHTRAPAGLLVLDVGVVPDLDSLIREFALSPKRWWDKVSYELLCASCFELCYAVSSCTIPHKPLYHIPALSFIHPCTTFLCYPTFLVRTLRTQVMSLGGNRNSAGSHSSHPTTFLVCTQVMSLSGNQNSHALVQYKRAHACDEESDDDDSTSASSRDGELAGQAPGGRER